MRICSENPLVLESINYSLCFGVTLLSANTWFPMTSAFHLSSSMVKLRQLDRTEITLIQQKGTHHPISRAPRGNTGFRRGVVTKPERKPGVWDPVHQAGQKK